MRHDVVSVVGGLGLVALVAYAWVSGLAVVAWAIAVGTHDTWFAAVILVLFGMVVTEAHRVRKARKAARGAGVAAVFIAYGADDEQR